MPKGNRQLFEQLIHAVQTREELYNPYCRGYKDRTTCDQAWRFVAHVTDLSPAEAKRTWSTLRSSYSRSLHNEQLSRGHPFSARMRWYLTSQMDFLRPFLQTNANNIVKFEEGEEEGELVPVGGGDLPNNSYAFDSFDSSVALDGFENGFENSHTMGTIPVSKPSNIDNQALIQTPTSTIELSCNKRPRLEIPSPSSSHLCSSISNPTSSSTGTQLRSSHPSDNGFSASTGNVNNNDNNTSKINLGLSTVLEEDPDILFFRSLLPSIRELDKKRQRKLRLTISKLVFDELEEQEEEEKRKQNEPSENVSVKDD